MDLDERDLSAKCTLKSIPTLLLRPQLPGSSVCYIICLITCVSGTARSPCPGKWGTELPLPPAHLLTNSYSISAALCPIHGDGNQYYLDPYRLVFEINHFCKTSQTTPQHKSSFPFVVASLEDISLGTTCNVVIFPYALTVYLLWFTWFDINGAFSTSYQIQLCEINIRRQKILI